MIPLHGERESKSVAQLAEELKDPALVVRAIEDGIRDLFDRGLIAEAMRHASMFKETEGYPLMRIFVLGSLAMVSALDHEVKK